MVLVAIVLTLVLVGMVSAQSNVATQSVTLGVSGIHKLSLGAAPASMVISDITTPGGDDLNTATANSTYSFTQNTSNTNKITASLSPTLAAGYKLQIKLTPGAGKGTGGTFKDISTTTQDVVTAIPFGFDLNAPIDYTFDAKASAGALTSASYTVTLTIVN